MKSIIDENFRHVNENFRQLKIFDFLYESRILMSDKKAVMPAITEMS